MSWRQISLKYVARFAYGDTLPRADDGVEGRVQVFGSNGPYATFSQANTRSPAIVIGRKGSYGKVNWTKEACFASDTTFFVDETTTQQHLRWLFYIFQTLDLDKGTDEAAVPGLNRDDAYERKIFVPTLPEQHAIADYLDQETSKIDSLIAGKERLLSLLAEKRRALVTQAVTRGLKPNVPMQDSGVEWLGEIPRHWAIEPLKYHLAGIEQGWSPQSDNFPANEDEWGVLKVSCVNEWEFNPDENKRLPFELEPLEEYEIKSGDVLISRANTTELVGSASLVHEVRPKLLLCDKLYRLRVQSARLRPDYLVSYLRSVPGHFEFERDATGASSSMKNISQESITSLRVPIPPRDEQEAIVMHTRIERSRLDSLYTATEQIIELLQERRAALISAAITGQIRVRVEP